MVKKRIRRIMTVLGFVFLFYIFFNYVTRTLITKENNSEVVARFYEEKKNSIDVIFLGSSHTYCGFSPMELWNSYGISSYNLGTSAQSMACSYYLLKEAIRTQSPEAVVLDIYSIQYKKYFYNEAFLHSAIDFIPLNSTKLELYQDLLCKTMSQEQALEYLFPIMKYHGRWNELNSRDFTLGDGYDKGSWMRYDIDPREEPEYTTETAKIFKGGVAYFDKIVQLCEENDVELVLCLLPMSEGKNYKKYVKRANSLIQHAEEKGLQTVNFELLREEINLDYSSDFDNSTHLNINGAVKVTRYIGEYLTTKYQITDHRGEEAYSSWNDDYQNYAAIVANNMKK